MASDDSKNETQARWQSQPPEGAAMSADEIRVRAQQFQRRIRNENVFQYAVLGGVSVWLVVSILLFKPVMIVQVALGLLVAGALVIGYQLHKRRCTRTLPRDLGLLPSIKFHRRELEREFDAQRSLALWYGLPVAPGLSVLIGALALTPDGRGVAPAAVLAASFGTVFVFIAVANRRKVRQLRQQIDELRAR